MGRFYQFRAVKMAIPPLGLSPRSVKPSHLFSESFFNQACMGFVMTRVILGILFFGALTPIAFIARVVGKRFLEQVDVHAGSYWQKRDPKAAGGERFEKQFSENRAAGIPECAIILAA